MHALWLAAFLLFSLARAALMNYTIDDTSPLLQYSDVTYQCPSTTCPASITTELFNGTVTLTNGSITFSFEGESIRLRPSECES
jgi:hypothetical protein